MQNTRWPRHSEDTVKSLADIMKQVPTGNPPSQDNKTNELVNVDQLASLKSFTAISALQTVKTKLDAAAERHGASFKPSTFFHRSETCNQVLNACRQDIMNALATLHSPASVDQSERSAAPPDETQAPRTSSGLDQERSLAGAERVPDGMPGSDQKAVNSAETASALKEEPVNETDSNARRKERLDWANKIFKGVEAVSGSLPIVGSYVGAAATVGLACVELAQLMDQNEGDAKTLESRTARLSEILKPFEVR
ncbi:hypothetical protein FRC01_001736 [Tulasnella sp. 417]|nr:hypothetical protein FRC01_001736 [Tulasnella sp. 417]